MLFLDERVEDCSDSHHSRSAGAIPAAPANERSMVRDAKKYASEFGLKLSLVHPQPLVTSNER